MTMDSTSPIRILLVEDHAVFRQALALAFGLDPELEVVCEAGSVAEGRPLLSKIDIAVLDLDLPDGTGASLIGELHNVSPRAEAIVLTASQKKLDIARAVEAGAAGVLHKSTPLYDIVRAVKRVAAGESLIPRRELIEMIQESRHQREAAQETEDVISRLTNRERDVLMALGEGLSDREIAEHLFISKETVHTHMVNMMGKLGVESRMQALIFAVKAGLVTLG
ncbi:MAG TPA: response regulator transcription factor [Thermomicrobiales bacterium]|nr:response regulator transcription factor [Thermomicrobiales bacterium]